MRHNNKNTKFARSRAQRRALIKSLLRSIVISERIKTTESKAKAMRGWTDKLITWGKRGDLHARRLSYKILGDHSLVKKLFDELAPRFKDVNGGYTRVLDLGYRKGDGALMSILELTKLETKGKKKAKAKEESSSKETEDKDGTTAKSKDSKKGIVSGMKKIFKKDKKSS